MNRIPEVLPDMNAVVNVNKPPDISSHQTVQVVRRLLGVKKAGHAGTLDPMATGVLLVCLNEATKVTRFLADLDKEYTMTVKLGESTDTYDATGAVVRQIPVEGIEENRLHEVLGRFTGQIRQVPPMYSALKKGGTPLYKLARKGISIEREERTVTIHSLTLLGLSLPFLDLRVACSKGTYMRTLCDDIGDALGVGAHMVSLTRTRIGNFSVEDAALPDEIREKRSAICSMDSSLSHLPGVVLSHRAFQKACNGISPSVHEIAELIGNSGGSRFPEGKETYVRLSGPGNILLGVGRLTPGREDIKIERLFQSVADPKK